MRWRRGKVSENIEDRRNQRSGRLRRFPGFPSGGASRGRVGLPLGGGRISLTTIVLVLLFLYCAGGSNLFSPGGGVGVGTDTGLPGGNSQVGLPPLPGGTRSPDVATGPGTSSVGGDELVEFVSFVLDDVQDTWKRTLSGYRDAKLVLYRDATNSGCGFGQAEMGPFYCPADQKVYIDLDFYGDLKRRFGAPGDFAQAYVLAHEIGHHIQKISGIETQVRRAQSSRPDLKNQLSVRMELQADCLAGVWAHSTSQRGILERGDVEEGLNAAASVGDDRIQRAQRGRVSPESFTHGSSQQRVEWFRRGLESGDPDSCDTFDGALGRF